MSSILGLVFCFNAISFSFSWAVVVKGRQATASFTVVKRRSSPTCSAVRAAFLKEGKREACEIARSRDSLYYILYLRRSKDI